MKLKKIVGKMKLLHRGKPLGEVVSIKKVKEEITYANLIT